MKLFSVAKYIYVVEMKQKRDKSVLRIVVKSLVVVKLVSVAKYKNVMEIIQKKKKKVVAENVIAVKLLSVAKCKKCGKEIVVKTLIVMLTIIIIEIKTAIVVKLISVAKNKYVGEINEKRNRGVRGIVA